MNAGAISDLSPKHYHPVGLWRMVPLTILAVSVVLSLGFVLLIVFLPSKMDMASRLILSVFGALIFLLIGILLSLGFRGMRLVTSPEGVTYYGIGFRVYTPWDNVKGMGEGVYAGNRAIGTRVYQPDRSVKGLLLRQPAVVGYKLNDGIREHIPMIEATFPLVATVNLSRFAGVIPTTTFFNDTTLEDFLADARRYAPSAFGTKEPLDHTPLVNNE